MLFLVLIEEAQRTGRTCRRLQSQFEHEVLHQVDLPVVVAVGDQVPKERVKR